MNTRWMMGAAGTALLAGGCAGTPAPDGPSVEVAVAPLTLPALSDACYRLTVKNTAGETVWQRGGLCADDYGDGQSAISYVGPCDASAGENGADNTVVLELEDLFDEGGVVDRDTYQNPCGHADNGNDDGFPACELAFECLENRDTQVEFNLTVMRDASQGFFDIAVNFDDIFCAAKLDCQYADRPIQLLFDPNTGERGQTAVLALACTAGTGVADDTVLHLSNVEVTCDGQTVSLDPTAGPGNVWTDANPDPDTQDAIWQYATYRGFESLTCGEGSCNKVYWNVAVGFDPAANCSISASATASRSDQMADHNTPGNASWPVIDYAVTLSEGGAVCGQNGLNQPGSGVATSYTDFGTPATFCHSFDGATTASADGCGQVEVIDLTGFQKDLQAQLQTLEELQAAYDALVLDRDIKLQERQELEQRLLEQIQVTQLTIADLNEQEQLAATFYAEERALLEQTIDSRRSELQSIMQQMTLNDVTLLALEQEEIATQAHIDYLASISPYVIEFNVPWEIFRGYIVDGVLVVDATPTVATTSAEVYALWDAEDAQAQQHISDVQMAYSDLEAINATLWQDAQDLEAQIAANESDLANLTAQRQQEVRVYNERIRNLQRELANLQNQLDALRNASITLDAALLARFDELATILTNAADNGLLALAPHVAQGHPQAPPIVQGWESLKQQVQALITLKNQLEGNGQQPS